MTTESNVLNFARSPRAMNTFCLKELAAIEAKCEALSRGIQTATLSPEMRNITRAQWIVQLAAVIAAQKTEVQAMHARLLHWTGQRDALSEEANSKLAYVVSLVAIIANSLDRIDQQIASYRKPTAPAQASVSDAPRTKRSLIVKAALWVAVLSLIAYGSHKLVD